MQTDLRSCELLAPADLTAALKALEDGDVRPFAGGTDLMVLAELGKLPHRRFVNLWGLTELGGIVESAEGITLGALTTYAEVQRHPTLRRQYPLLCAAAGETGGVAIQNRGTLGGNIANGSPAADSPPALLVYDAELELRSTRGARWIRYADFHRGYRRSVLESGELIARLRLPTRPAGWRATYRKVGTRRAQAISKVCFAAGMRQEGDLVVDVRLALGSVAPAPLRCLRVEAALRGARLDAERVRAALAELAAEIAPVDDFRSTARYRLRVAQNLLAEFLCGPRAETVAAGESA